MKRAHIDSAVSAGACSGAILPRHEQLQEMLSRHARSHAKVSRQLASPRGGSPLHEAPAGLGGFASARLLFFAGVAVQLALLIARQLIKRRSTDPEVAARMLDIVDLIGDGVTVFAFALGTLSAVLGYSAAV